MRSYCDVECGTSKILRDILGRCPSLLTRLSILSRLHHPEREVSGHPAASKETAREELDLALRHIHEATFAEWLCCSLEEKQRHLKSHLSGLNSTEIVAARTWENRRPYQPLVPNSASDAERRLFFGEIETLLHAMTKGDRAGGEFEEREPCPLFTGGRQFRSKTSGISAHTRKQADTQEPREPDRSAARGAGLHSCAVACSCASPATFTLREQLVLELIAQGRTSKEIAARMSISSATVRQHRKHICAKIGLHSTAELVACAVGRQKGACRHSILRKLREPDKMSA